MEWEASNNSEANVQSPLFLYEWPLCPIHLNTFGTLIRGEKGPLRVQAYIIGSFYRCVDLISSQPSNSPAASIH